MAESKVKYIAECSIPLIAGLVFGALIGFFTDTLVTSTIAGGGAGLISSWMYKVEIDCSQQSKV